ncbi:MAG: FHA domain-containing protein [Prevotella sp.]|nr:FHA domain-containing protein [Prevotella sp.]
MIQILIGRDASDNRLKMTLEKKSQTFGTPGSVPQSVSRQHCILTVDDTTHTMRISNCNEQKNVTFVNGMRIESCQVTTSDTIELGFQHYLLNWEIVMSFVDQNRKKEPETADIRGLETVWLNYKKQSDHLMMTEKITNVLKSGIPILTMCGVAAGYLLSKEGGYVSNTMKYVYPVAILLAVFFFVKSLIDSRNIPKKREKLNKQMIQDYSCPNCHYYFGGQSYDVIKINLDTCPKCKAKLIK